jgi:hypothetical protein
MTEIDELRSPTRKLIRFFVSSRDGWKAKCVDAKYELKLLKRKHQRLNRRCDSLAERCKQLQGIKKTDNHSKGE